MYPIDVHILTLPGEDKRLFDICLDSLKNEPVNIHICEGIVGCTGTARANAFLKGTAKYVSFVDPDDYIEPGIFDKCLEVLESKNCNVYTTENYVDDGGNFLMVGPQSTHPWSYTSMRRMYVLVHHLVVYQRVVVEKHLHWIRGVSSLSEYMLNLLCSLDVPFEHINEVGYYWRQLNKDRSLRNLSNSHENISRICKYIKEQR